MSTGYEVLLSNVLELLQRGRQNAAASVNAVLTTTYWLVGRRLVEFEQRGKGRAVYGSELLKKLSGDLQSRFGRGFSERNLEQMRQFYLQWENPQTVSAVSAAGVSPKISQTPSAKLSLGDVPVFSLSWSHYVRLASAVREIVLVLVEKAPEGLDEICVDLVHAGLGPKFGEIPESVFTRLRCPDSETIPGLALTILAVSQILLDCFAHSSLLSAADVAIVGLLGHANGRPIC
jgi:hypothetical protein